METQTDISLLTAKARVFFEKGIAVHITTHSGSWYNGLIKEHSVAYINVETFPHLTMKLIFFDEIKSIESYQPRK